MYTSLMANGNVFVFPLTAVASVRCGIEESSCSPGHLLSLTAQSRITVGMNCVRFTGMTIVSPALSRAHIRRVTGRSLITVSSAGCRRSAAHLDLYCGLFISFSECLQYLYTGRCFRPSASGGTIVPIRMKTDADVGNVPSSRFPESQVH